MTAEAAALLAAGDEAGALSALRSAVSGGDRRPPLLLNLAVAEGRAGDDARAGALFDMLERCCPGWEEPALRRAERARAAGRMDEAADAYERVLAINPARPEALIGLAVLLLREGRPERAASLLLRACHTAPDRAEAWDALGFALMGTEDATGAASAFAEAHRLAPGEVSYALHRVEACGKAGILDAELARLEAAATSEPLDTTVAIARGAALEALGRLDDAADAQEIATALDPGCAVAASMLACVLVAANRLEEADAALGRAIVLDPDSALLANNRAVVLMRLHRPAEARALLLDLLARHPPEPGVLCNLATATLSCGQQAEAEAIVQAAIRLAPDQALPRRTLCNTLIYGAAADGASVLAALRACSDRLARSEAPPLANARDPERRLRLGLLSGTMRTHPVGWLTIGAFEALDPAAFDIVGLSQMRSDDPIARRFHALASEWHDIARLDDAGLRRLARDAAIDLLIDLGGYGDAGRMPACALRLAPVQVKWVGMQNHSTGLPEMDWFITDRWETPPGYEHLYSERLLRLPDGYVCYAPPPHAPDVGPLPAHACRHVTFGCFNNIAKVTPHVIRTWARILHRVSWGAARAEGAPAIRRRHGASDAGRVR